MCSSSTRTPFRPGVLSRRRSRDRESCRRPKRCMRCSRKRRASPTGTATILARTGEPLEGVKNIRRARRQAAAELKRPRTPVGVRQRQLLVSMDLATADAFVVQGRYGQARRILARSPSEQAPGLQELLSLDPAAYREQVINSDIY